MEEKTFRIKFMRGQYVDIPATSEEAARELFLEGEFEEKDVVTESFIDYDDFVVQEQA